jgi:hypothetical protein
MTPTFEYIWLFVTTQLYQKKGVIVFLLEKNMQPLKIEGLYKNLYRM